MPEPTEHIVRNLALADPSIASYLIRRFAICCVLTIVLLIMLVLTSIAIQPTASTCKAVSEVLERISKLEKIGLPLEIAIFVNNLMISLLMAVPFLGFFVMALTFYNTASFLKCCSLLLPNPIGYALPVTLFMYPHSYLEMLGYAISISICVEFTNAIVRKSKEGLVRKIRLLPILLLVQIVVLYVAALVEVRTIHMTVRTVMDMFIGG